MQKTVAEWAKRLHVQAVVEWLDKLRVQQSESMLSVILVLLSIPIGAIILVPDQTATVLGAVERIILFELGFVFLFAVVFLLIGFTALALSPWGAIRLGGDDATPEYSNIPYFSLLVTTGIASGIAFFGPGEAANYMIETPPGIEASAGLQEFAVWGMGYTLLHWGVLTTTIYAVIAVPLAYYCYTKGAPFRLSSVLYPIFTDRPVAAKSFDAFAVVIILLGLINSVGEVAANFLSGVRFQWGVADPGTIGLVMFTLGMTAVFVSSTVTGINRGILRLAYMTVAGVTIIALGTLIFGPTQAILSMSAQATAAQPEQLWHITTNLRSDWVGFWTMFNWAIWFAWAGFIGLFVARISRGRTIREIIGYTIFASGVANMGWFYIIGGAVLEMELSEAGDITGLIEQEGFEVVGYAMLLELPVGELFLFVFLGMALLAIISSADSAALSVAMITNKDSTNPPRISRAFWSSLIGAVSIFLLIAGGGSIIGPLATMGGFAFAIISVLAFIVFARELVSDGVEVEPDEFSQK